MENKKLKELIGNIPEITATIKGESVFVKLGGIDWRVLTVENNKALLISEKILARLPYDREGRDITWENCTLRESLNAGLLHNKLGAAKSAIAETRNINNDNLWYGTSGGNATVDKIFLLSLEEADKYFGGSGDYLDKRRKDSSGYLFSAGSCISNAYNEGRIAKRRNAKYGMQWWLRSPGSRPNVAAYVSPHGDVNVIGDPVCFCMGGVRPALWLNLQNEVEPIIAREIRINDSDFIDNAPLAEGFVSVWTAEKLQKMLIDVINKGGDTQVTQKLCDIIISRGGTSVLISHVEQVGYMKATQEKIARVAIKLASEFGKDVCVSGERLETRTPILIERILDYNKTVTGERRE